MSEKEFIYLLGLIVLVFGVLLLKKRPTEESGFDENAFKETKKSDKYSGNAKTDGKGNDKTVTDNDMIFIKKKTSGQLILPSWVISGKEPHEVLGIKKEASANEIKLAHKHLIKMCHPDRFTGEKDRAKAEESAVRINNAKDEMLKAINELHKNKKG